MSGTAAVDTPARDASATVPRRPYLDNIKIALIAAIIVIHAILGYAGMVVAWTYTEVREVTLAPVTEIALFLVAAPFALFLIALLFLVAGLLTTGSRDRKGTGRFARDRLMRLGIPFVVYVFLIQPVLVYALAHPLGLLPGSIWDEWFGPERRLDTGPLWFVGVLLVFSLGYAVLYAVVRSSPGRHTARGSGRGHGRPITARTLALLAAVVAPASFAVRLLWPYGSESGISDLNFWEWPACLAVFGLGVAAAGQGWLDRVPPELVRRCGVVTAVGVAAVVVLLAVAGLRDGIDALLGGVESLGGGLRRCGCGADGVRLGVAARRGPAPPRPHLPVRPGAGPRGLRCLHPADRLLARDRRAPQAGRRPRRGQGVARGGRRPDLLIRGGLAPRALRPRVAARPVTGERLPTRVRHTPA
ncbi:acyltransferase [Nostocoides sp. F2B08]|uniref:acyltransferase family protein n=1 Tax=Nostocoides sp. F2B08 TaxID=2653936 RepID=UPI00186B37AA|nr:acyltransferase [Tetrasphaera sp. F2B08]